MNDQLKKLDWQDAITNGIVGVSGTVYKLESELSARRYVKLQEFLIEISTGTTAHEFIKAVSRAYEHLQTPRIMDAGEELRKVLYGAKNMSQIPHPAQKAVALLFNAENESIEERREYDEARITAKIKDWENYGIEGFFQLLRSTVIGLKPSSSANSNGQLMTDHAN